MKELSETEAPPVVYMDTVELVCFVIIWLLIGCFIVIGLLWLDGFDDVLLGFAGMVSACYFWPRVVTGVKAWLEFRRFKKSIPDGM